MSKNINKDEDVLTINLSPYLTPISIVLAGIMISIAVLLGSRSNGVLSVNVTPTPTVVIPEEENPTTTTTIDDDPYLGNKETAKVAIVEFSDYECPFCKRHHQQVFPDIVKDYVESGKAIYVYRDYIAVPSHNPAATNLAYTLNCVREQLNSNTKYYELADLIYANTTSNGGGVSKDKMNSLISQIGGNVDNVNNCVDSGKFADELSKDQLDAQKAGIQGTPGFVVGILKDDGSVEGKIIAGAYPYETFKSIIEEMLNK